MLILEAINIKKYFSDRLIVSFEELKIHSGDRIGIIGQNGSGKTTLLNILSKGIEPDEGFVRHFCDIAYIQQFSEELPEADQRLLKEFDLSGKTHQNVFSGGEKTKIKIANALSKRNVLLFADEPTSNLDYKGIELLKQKLNSVETFMLISHDKFLLDSLCDKIIEVKNGKLKFFNGNYTSYKEQSKMEFERAEQEYENYVSAKIALEEAIRDRQGKAKSLRKTPKRMGNSEARLHKRSTTEIQQKINSAVSSMKTRLDKLEVKEKPKELPKIKLDFSMTNPPENKIVISAEQLSFSYDGSEKIFDNAGFKVYNGLKTAIWGENGAGKTTLLNLVSRNPDEEKIYIVPKAILGYFYQGFENLDHNKTVLENVMEESVQTQTVARTILSRLLISGDDVYKKVGCLSGGERIKVSFAKLFVSKVNILLLDEPTNFLDIEAIEALEAVLCEYEGTVLFVSHDKAFVNAVADRLFIIEDKKIIEYDGKLDTFEASRQKDNTKSKIKNETVNLSEMERLAIQMRLTEVVAKLSKSDADKDILEAEYQQLLQKLK